MKIGIQTFKTLKDGRVVIETKSKDEINALSTEIAAKCGDQLDVNVPTLHKPRMIIYNIPDDIDINNAEETILSQNPDINLKQGDITAKFRFTGKKGKTNLIIIVGPQTQKALLQKKLKIGWLICNVEVYLVATRCFKCSRYNHRHQHCRGEVTCPLCAGAHSLRGKPQVH